MQVGLFPDVKAMDTAGVIVGLTVMVIPVEVAVVEVTQVSLEVISQVMI